MNSSDQFRRIQTGSMDGSRDQAHDHTQSGGLFTSSASSLVGPVGGGFGKNLEGFRTPRIQKKGLGRSPHCNSETRRAQNFARLPHAYPAPKAFSRHAARARPCNDLRRRGGGGWTANGAGAVTAGARKLGSNRTRQDHNGPLEYCGQDTLALVRLLVVLRFACG
jgi:hypothetical protein